MALKNRRAAKRVAAKPCEMCGTQHVPRHAAHVVDEVKGSGTAADGDWNALSLCPNCHSLFEDVLRPKLYKALVKSGARNLPGSWEKSNKLSLTGSSNE